MLSFFRTFLKSKVGAFVGLFVLGLMAFAFASGDIMGYKIGSSGEPDSVVATVGKETITAGQLERSAKQALERVKQQNPELTMTQLLAQGGLKQVLDSLIEGEALYAFGTKHGVIASDRLVDSELAQIPAFQGVNGKFDQDVFRQMLAQQRISEQELRASIRKNMVAQEIMTPAQIGAIMPEFAAKQYAALLDENRSGSVIALPSILFAPQTQPSDKDLAAFYKAHTSAFVRPERRTIRFATLDAASIKQGAAPTDAQIQARFDANKALYAAKNNRRITQLIVPTEAAAKAVAQEVQNGKTLEAAAQSKGLATARLDAMSQEDIGKQFSPAVAQAVFASPVGKLAAPQKSLLGWHVIRVDEEQKIPARTLADVKGELREQLVVENHRKALTDTLANIEEQFANGASLNEVAKSLNASIQKTQPLTADGQVYLKPGEMAPAAIAPVLATAFGMDEERPQVAEVERGKTFIVYDVTKIEASAPAPLNDIKNDVKMAWAIDAGAKAAKAEALRMMAELRKGKTAEQVAAASGKQLPPVQNVSMSRPTLAAALRSGREVPPPVSLMFHMSKGTVKVQSAANGRGWFVVQLKDITPGKVESAEMLKGARSELGQQLGQAYATSLGVAARKDVGVKRNGANIRAVRDQLAGANTAN